MDHVVELADEVDGLEVFLGAVLVEVLGVLVPVGDAEIQVQDTGDTVHPEAVHVVAAQPVHRR